jgi:hypothetical protein
LAFAAYSRLRAMYEPGLSLVTLFRYPTIRSLAGFLSRSWPSPSPERRQGTGTAAAVRVRS